VALSSTSINLINFFRYIAGIIIMCIFALSPRGMQTLVSSCICRDAHGERTPFRRRTGESDSRGTFEIIGKYSPEVSPVETKTLYNLILPPRLH
jgi:hypothetical protein